MREIKFRAWDKNNKEMFEVKSLDWYNSLENFFEISRDVQNGINFESRYYQMEDVELMQYTGLKDKNGVDIYEGDIVKIENMIMGFVKFNEGQFWIYKKEVDHVDVERFSVPIVMEEVIGNIYENPELLIKK